MKKVLINRYLSLSRAAKLVGVKRGTLQKRIQAGELITFEGDLSLEELLKAYPQTEYSDDAMIDKTSRIKATAVRKLLHEEPILPSAEVLGARVNKLSTELNHANAIADKYISLMDEVKSRLDRLQQTTTELDQLKNWLYAALEKPVAQEAATSLIADDNLLSLMTAHVRILPSGHDFFSEGSSSLLEGGLRSGLALNYACSNGNCGQCMARVVSGEVSKTSHHDYIISDELKASGHVLMCCNTAVTDVVLEALEAHSASDIPQQKITARVKKVAFPEENVALLHLKTPRTNRLRFLAGQYVLLGGNNTPAANHSVSSCPCDDMNLHFQIPRIAGNEFSDHVFNTLKNGDEVEINGPRGEFTLDENSPRSLVFIVWHTGFAPIRSLVEHAMALETAETIHVVWIAPSTKERYLSNLCRSWQDALDNFIYTSIDAEMKPETAGKNTAIISKLTLNLDDLADYDFYIAGNQPLIDACETVLINNGLPREQLVSDLIKHD